ncbi:MAG: hypothetical protein JRH20_15395 [Deltaproteobacteria bacterium]|nr:hypothetical protein [Deltaproteobacteria bacterium]
MEDDLNGLFFGLRPGVAIMRSMLRPEIRLIAIALLLSLGACGHTSAGGGSGAKAPLLIQEERLPEAVVQRNRNGRIRKDIAALRDRLCVGHEEDPVIFYQLVVSHHWHYYWVCSSTRVKRAATRRGVKILQGWLRRIKKRARRESSECEAGNADKMFRQRHTSGIVVKAYCDGVLIVRYPDRSRITVAYSGRGAGGGGAGSPSRGDYPSVGPVERAGAPIRSANTARCPTCPPPQRCPAQRACPPARPCPSARACPPQRACPRCPPQRACPRCPAPKPCPKCPAPNTKASCKVFGEKAFWQGVKSACKRICGSIYKKCRSIDKKTAMCYSLSEYCSTLRGVCGKR